MIKSIPAKVKVIKKAYSKMGQAEVARRFSQELIYMIPVQRTFD